MRGYRASPLNNRGSVLLISLWATATLAALEITQATQVSLELKWGGRLQEERQAWYLAWTGVELAQKLLSLDNPAWDAPVERWGQVSKEPIPFGPGTFRYRILDEQAKIPLNTAPREVLLRLPGFRPDVVDKLLSQRTQPEPKQITHLAELLVVGVESRFLPELEPLVSVQSVRPVNINTASSSVLQILGFSPQLAARIVQYRFGPDGTWGTSDDRIFDDAQKIVSVLNEQFGPLVAEDQQVEPLLLGVSSSLFRVETEGWTTRHGVRKKAVALLDRAGTVRGWHED